MLEHVQLPEIRMEICKHIYRVAVYTIQSEFSELLFKSAWDIFLIFMFLQNRFQ